MTTVDQDGKIFVGKSVKPEYLTLHFANRHGLVSGATGTGKTVTLQVMAQALSDAGVAVFMADIKGRGCSRLMTRFPGMPIVSW